MCGRCGEQRDNPAFDHCNQCVTSSVKKSVVSRLAVPIKEWRGDDDDDSLSTMTDGESAELTCLMADADPNDTKEPNSKFGWSILPDGTGVQVHVQGVHKATVTPDAVNRRFIWSYSVLILSCRVLVHF